MGDHCFKVDTNEEFNNITPMQIRDDAHREKKSGEWRNWGKAHGCHYIGNKCILMLNERINDGMDIELL